MNIVVLTGSAHKKGTSAMLADKFIEGATEVGHTVSRFDTAHLKIHPCIGCDHCGNGTNECVFKDDMLEIYEALKKADLVAFVTPLYYHTMSATLKAAIDRFYGINNDLCGAKKKSVLMVSAADSADWNFEGIKAWYKADMHYLEWEDVGQICAGDSGTLEEMLKTDYPQRAYELDKSI